MEEVKCDYSKGEDACSYILIILQVTKIGLGCLALPGGHRLMCRGSHARRRLEKPGNFGILTSSQVYILH